MKNLKSIIVLGILLFVTATTAAADKKSKHSPPPVYTNTTVTKIVTVVETQRNWGPTGGIPLDNSLLLQAKKVEWYTPPPQDPPMTGTYAQYMGERARDRAQANQWYPRGGGCGYVPYRYPTYYHQTVTVRMGVYGSSYGYRHSSRRYNRYCGY